MFAFNDGLDFRNASSTDFADISCTTLILSKVGGSTTASKASREMPKYLSASSPEHVPCFSHSYVARDAVPMMSAIATLWSNVGSENSVGQWDGQPVSYCGQ